MKIAEMNWPQVEEWLKGDDRAVLPLGSTEQHAFLSLSVDSILADRVAAEAAEPLGVPVFPVLAYGITPSFRAYPGSMSLRVSTYCAVLRDLLDCMAGQGFRRILLVNGHGGNQPAASLAQEYMADNPGMSVRFHNWWNAPKTMARIREFDDLASHASWMENFPWTRLAEVAQPEVRKPLVDFDRMRALGPEGVRELLGDGNFGGLYQRPDQEMLAIWATGVEETRAMIEGPWA